MGVPIYELGEVAALLHLEKSRIKNWTIGRPFTVRPSLRSSAGKGSRNLFGVTDLYCFALVKHFVDLEIPRLLMAEVDTLDLGFYAVNLKPIADELSLTPDKYFSAQVRSASGAFSGRRDTDFPTTSRGEMSEVPSIEPEVAKPSTRRAQAAHGSPRKYVRTNRQPESM
jgi:hypothetical protein